MNIDEMEWPLSKEELEYLIFKKFMRSKKIGNKFNVSGSLVRKKIRSFNIETYYYKNTKTTKKFKKQVYGLVNSEYTVLGDYKNQETKIKIKHNKCGLVLKIKPVNFLHHNRRCSHCYPNSINEIKIMNFLKTKDIKFKRQFSYKECKNKIALRFDFKIKNKPIVIEYNGIQHYEPVEYFGGEEKFKYQQENDQIKKDYCQANNIKLIIIPYWRKDNIEEILEEELKEVL